MSFEITDQEAEEVHFTVGKKLKGIDKVLENGEKGMTIRGKDRLLERQPIMKELIERLESNYPNLKEA